MSKAHQDIVSQNVCCQSGTKNNLVQPIPFTDYNKQTDKHLMVKSEVGTV